MKSIHFLVALSLTSLALTSCTDYSHRHGTGYATDDDDRRWDNPYYDAVIFGDQPDFLDY